MKTPGSPIPDEPVIESFFNDPSWNILIEFFNSSFVSSLMGALCGAFAGAFIAHRFMVHYGQRRERIEQIRNVNAAVSFAIGLCNFGMSLKGQHLLAFVEEFKLKREDALQHIEEFKRNPSEAASVFHVGASLLRLPRPTYPIDNLGSVVFDRLSLAGKPLGAAASAFSSYDQLINMIDHRNRLIDTFRNTYKPGEPDEDRSRSAEFVFRFLGLETPQGHVDMEYADTLNGMLELTDDLIFFSATLCEELISYGNEVVEGLSSREQQGIPKVVKVDFSKAREKGLIPDEENYEHWLVGFRKGE